MKKLSLFLCLTLMLSLVFGTTAGAWVSAADGDDGVIATAVGLDVTPAAPAIVTVNVPADGVYALGFEYKALDDKISDFEIAVQVDGAYPSEALADMTLPRHWTVADLEKPYRVDGQGNQFAAEPVQYMDYISHYLLDTDGYDVKPISLSLTAGEHQLSISSGMGEFHLQAVLLNASFDAAAYAKPALTEQNAYAGDDVVVEGETAAIKSSYWLTTGSDIGSSKVHPSDPVLSLVNYVGGATWKDPGSTMYWTVKAPQAGWYNLGFSYRQSYVLNGSTYRWLRVNGKTPFAEATSISFPYATDWTYKMMGKTDAEGVVAPYAVYLNEGENQISLTTTLGEYAAICAEMELIVNDLRDLYLDIAMITGETVDLYRDYRLFDQIPGFEDRLRKADEALAAVNEKLLIINNGETSNHSASVLNMRTVIQKMLDNRFDSHRQKSTFYNNYSSISANLNDLQNMPLDIDQIVFTAVDATEVTDRNGKNAFAAFFENLGYSISRFFASFSQDYNNVSGVADENNDSVTIWVAWGQDQAQVLNMLVQSSFTQKYPNINVSVKISNATIIQGVLSGNGPDITLQHARTEPVNLAMRGVLYDLSQFKDTDSEYDAIINRFSKNATDPYLYRDGLYALPDTQNFQMMFYRTDVFEELGIDPPTDTWTWKDFEKVARILTRNNLNAWLPYTQLTDLNLVNSGVGVLNLFPTLLLQNGLSMYNDTYTATAMTEPEVIEVFTKWTDYYTKMKLPYQLDFITRFRLGTTPIGIASYTTYNTLRAGAKEIEGKWKMVEIPGTVRADGTYNNSSAGGGTACAILKEAASPEAAWTFLKWWTDADTQVSYSNNLESILGPVSRVAVSNEEALKGLAWDSESLNALLSARSKVQEIREVPGSYYVSRALDFAFWNVASMNKNPKDMMQTWGEEANAEIKRKLEQYENR